MRMAYGHVVPQDIRWMTETMERYNAGNSWPDKPVILVTHYPMTEGDVDNWYEVTDAVRPYNIRLFIGGHYHRDRDLRYDGIPGILMRSNLRDRMKSRATAFMRLQKILSSFIHNASENRKDNGPHSR